MQYVFVQMELGSDIDPRVVSVKRRHYHDYPLYQSHGKAFFQICPSFQVLPIETGPAPPLSPLEPPVQSSSFFIPTASPTVATPTAQEQSVRKQVK